MADDEDCSNDDSDHGLLEGNCLMPGCLEFGGSKCEICDADLCGHHLEIHDCEVLLSFSLL
jgi:hypothetical protein